MGKRASISNRFQVAVAEGRSEWWLKGAEKSKG